MLHLIHKAVECLFQILKLAWAEQLQYLLNQLLSRNHPSILPQKCHHLLAYTRRPCPGVCLSTVSCAARGESLLLLLFMRRRPSDGEALARPLALARRHSFLPLSSLSASSVAPMPPRARSTTVPPKVSSRNQSFSFGN